MPDFLLTLRDIVLLRRGPQDLPYSPSLLIAVTVAAALMNYLLGTVLFAEPRTELLNNALGVGLCLGVLYLVLLGKQRQERFVQTALASMLAEVLNLALLLPLAAAAGPMPLKEPKPEDINGLQVLLMLPMAAIGLWKFVIEAHVLRHALEVRLILALPLAFAIRFAAAILLIALLGKPAEGT